MKRRLTLSISAAMAVTLVTVGLVYRNELSWFVRRLPIINRFFRPTVESRIAAYGAGARARLKPIFASKQVPHPPDRVAFLAIKATKQLEVYGISAG